MPALGNSFNDAAAGGSDVSFRRSGSMSVDDGEPVPRQAEAGVSWKLIAGIVAACAAASALFWLLVS